MDYSTMLPNAAHGAALEQGSRRMGHQLQQHTARSAVTVPEQHEFAKPYSSTASRSLRSSGIGSTGSAYLSPAKKDKKHIVFQLIDPADPRIQARLPMRVMISPHDTAESIIATIKNFYGLYEYGVSFEDKDGVGMIAAYDNFEHDMAVYVRTVPLPPGILGDYARESVSPKKPSLGAPIDLRHGGPYAGSPSRSAAAAVRSPGRRSLSPQSDAGRRSMSGAPSGRHRQSRPKSKDNSIYGDADGYSSGDNGGGSVASSRRSKAEPVNAEISVDNIVEGGRRKRAFESSVPMSTSISSVSPQRRAGPPNTASPYAYSNQQTFSYQQPLPSPQSYISGGNGAHSASAVAGNGYPSASQSGSRQLRGRSNQIFYQPRHSGGGIMPTPDPTVGSAISDEDVALQLMRLGDPTAFSHGRTSNSTADDALSGKAEAASSDEDDDEGDTGEEQGHFRRPSGPRLSNGDVGPARKKQRLMAKELASDVTSGDDYDDQRDNSFHGNDDARYDLDSRRKSKSGKQRSSLNGAAGSKPSRPRSNSTVKPKSKNVLGASIGSTSSSTSITNGHKGLVSPASMPAPSRKGSIASLAASAGAGAPPFAFQHALAADEDDLSSKPRCQRCRKSKKGCDRQRPCGRCRDAGIGPEGCVSEDEGNGRKGRYGRHMGVTIKRADDAFGDDEQFAEESSYSGAAYEHEHKPVFASGQSLLPPAAYTAASAATSDHYAPLPGHNIGPGGERAMPTNGLFLAPALPDKSKKRKR